MREKKTKQNRAMPKTGPRRTDGRTDAAQASPIRISWLPAEERDKIACVCKTGITIIWSKTINRKAASQSRI
jgi:hypothetical protein